MVDTWELTKARAKRYMLVEKWVERYAAMLDRRHDLTPEQKADAVMRYRDAMHGFVWTKAGE